MNKAMIEHGKAAPQQSLHVAENVVHKKSFSFAKAGGLL